MDAADSDTPDIVVVVQRCDLELDGAFVHRCGRNVFENGVHQGKDGVACAVLQILGRPAVAAAGIEDGEVELFFCGVQVYEEIEYFGEHLFGTGVGTVDLVDDDNRFEIELERLVEHEPGLGKGAFGGVDQKQNAVGHIEYAFDLPAEVAVPGCVDDIDFAVFVTDTDIFCQNGDAAFAFNIVAVEETLMHFLIFAENFCLFDDFVDKRGFAMVDVCNDGDVSDVLHKEGLFPLLKKM